MKRIASKIIYLFSLLSLMVLFTIVFSTETNAACYQSSEDDYEYELEGSGVKITKYTGASLQQVTDPTYSVVVPNKINGHTVKSIAPYAFAEQKHISEFVIPKTVSTIGDHAFFNCYSMNKITLPSSLIKIGAYAFYNTQLKTISIPKKVSKIGSYAFGCDGSSVISQCTAISVDKSNAKYSAANGVLYNKSQTNLIYYPGAKKDKTFTIPSKVKSLTDWTFNDARRLTGISMSKSKITSLPNNAFQIASLTKISLPSKLKKIGAHTFEKSGITTITIPSQVTSVGESAFNNCCSLKKVVISSKNLTILPTEVFAGCRLLRSITLPDSLTTIGEGAFNNCISLKKIIIPTSVISIGDRAFRLCEELTTVTIKGTVMSIGYTAFDGDPNLKIIAKKGTYPESYAKQKNIRFGAL